MPAEPPGVDGPVWVEASPDDPCPVCRTTVGCLRSRDGVFAVCLNTASRWPVTPRGCPTTRYPVGQPPEPRRWAGPCSTPGPHAPDHGGVGGIPWELIELEHTAQTVVDALVDLRRTLAAG